jgi:PAS domain S-box-containing protein
MEDGTEHHFRSAGVPIFDANGAFKGYRGVSALETEQVEAERRARSAVDRLVSAVESVPVGFALYDEEDRLVLCNERYRELSTPIADLVEPGVRFEYVINALVERGAVPEAIGRENAWIEERMQRHRNPSEPFELLRTDRWLQVREHKPTGGGTFVIISDIGERKRAEEALHRSEEQFRNLIEGSIQGILIVDNDARIIFANPSLVEMFGYESVEEVLALQSVDPLLAPHERDLAHERLEKRIRGERIVSEYEFDGLHKDGHIIRIANQVRLVSWNGQPAVQNTYVDVTEQRRAEEQLRQSQKMEAVGQLTGGIAHDFNNLLGVILGHTELAQERLGIEDSSFQAVIRAANRGAELTHRLLAFSRRQPLQPRVIDLIGLVEGMTELLRRSLGEAIEIETSSKPGLWKVMADPGQVEIALLNFAINARDAMPGGGKLSIELANIPLDDSHAAAQADVAPGDYVALSVTDTGIGMPPEVRARVFEPFFTTKETGAGSGLGLSMVYGFAKQSGGHVTVYSEEGHGTTVKLYLPRTQETDYLAVPEDSSELPETRGETILLVEDDPDMQTLSVALVANLGYEVLAASDGKAALRALQESSRIDLLFVDVVLPGGMNGPALAVEIQRRRPEIKVLFMSGYVEKGIRHQARLDEGIECLMKPFGKVDLARKLRAVLDKAVE